MFLKGAQQLIEQWL